MKTARQEAEFSLSKWDESRVSSFGQEDGQHKWKLDGQQLELTSVFPTSISFHIPLYELDVLQNPLNEQPYRKVDPLVQNVC